MTHRLLLPRPVPQTTIRICFGFFVKPGDQDKEIVKLFESIPVFLVVKENHDQEAT